MFYLPLPFLICIAGFAIAFHHWRKYPILQDAINFKQSRWLPLFISLGIMTVGFIGILTCLLLDKVLPPSHSGEKITPLAMIGLVFTFIITGGIFCFLYPQSGLYGF